jgi:hypothetical protein
MLRISMLALGVVAAFAGAASAQQHPIQTANGEKIAHTRLAPVVVHRIFPPYGMRIHVYETPRGTVWLQSPLAR